MIGMWQDWQATVATWPLSRSFTWGASAADAVHNAAILEHLSALAIRTLTIEPYARPFPRELLDKHYYRKHGERAYYGQERGTD